MISQYYIMQRLVGFKPTLQNIFDMHNKVSFYYDTHNMATFYDLELAKVALLATVIAFDKNCKKFPQMADVKTRFGTNKTIIIEVELE